MKTTLKQYQLNVAVRNEISKAIRTASDEGDFLKENKQIELRKYLDTTYFDLLPTVNVKFYIGYRDYYRAVTKIGKNYFTHFEKMTKRSGYRSIEEIEEITDKMNESMIADSYYY